jgi:hypothetical protein
MKDAKVVVENGTFYGTIGEVVFVQNNASIEILGGSFKHTTDPEWTLNILGRDVNTASIKVSGGSFYKFNPADSAVDGISTNYVVTGKTVEQDGDWFIVK